MQLQQLCAPSGIAVANDIISAFSNDIALSINNDSAEAATCKLSASGRIDGLLGDRTCD
jgi:hypothetical protein